MNTNTLLKTIPKDGGINITFEYGGSKFDGYIYIHEKNEVFDNTIFMVYQNANDGGRASSDRHGFKYGRRMRGSAGFFGINLRAAGASVNACDLCGIETLTINKTCANCTKLIDNHKKSEPIKKIEPVIDYISEGRVDVKVDTLTKDQQWAAGFHVSSNGTHRRLCDMNDTHLRRAIDLFQGRFDTHPLELELMSRGDRDGLQEEPIFS